MVENFFLRKPTKLYIDRKGTTRQTQNRFRIRNRTTSGRARAAERVEIKGGDLGWELLAPLGELSGHDIKNKSCLEMNVLSACQISSRSERKKFFRKNRLGVPPQVKNVKFSKISNMVKSYIVGKPSTRGIQNRCRN